MKLFEVVSLEEAESILKKSFVYNLESDEVSLFECTGRICSNDIKSDCNVPEFRRSTVDGFAVNSRDTFGASEAIPAMLTLKNEVLMGDAVKENISLGECMYVPTGAMIPDNSDSVIMLEYTEALDESTVMAYTSSRVGENLIEIGEDVEKDEVIIKEGQKIRPYETGVLASIGVSKVNVYKKLKIGIISTGDELVANGEEIKFGQVRDVNTYLLWSLINEDLMEPVSYGIINDDYDNLKRTMDKAFEECDIVLISGGSSVGKKDQTIDLISSYDDGEILVHGISIKPGKPTIIGKHNNKVIFGLPGHPLACAIVYKVLVSKFINNLMNNNKESYPISAVIDMDYHKAKGREEYLPVSIKIKDNKIIASPILGKSGLMSLFSKAYGYVRIHKDLEGLREGQQVDVFRL